MKPSEFWKNFKIGEELGVSGTFIYNGVRRFYELRKLDHTDELFEVFYNLAVGFERLLKIAVVLLEHDDSGDQAKFEESLKTHSHSELFGRVKKVASVELGRQHTDFLRLLEQFYQQTRYGRFSIDSVIEHPREKAELCQFLTKHLKVSFSDDEQPFGIFNDDQYRKFIRKLSLKISSDLFQIIKVRAGTLGLYTDELRHGSKAETVFLGETDIHAEDTLWKELLVFFMNTKETNGYLKFLRETPPLEFDPGDIDDYLDCFQADAAKAFVIDQLEHLYQELPDKSERLMRMGVIGSPNVYFGDDEEDNDDEFEPLA
jgi:hypothetical protein